MIITSISPSSPAITGTVESRARPTASLLGTAEGVHVGSFFVHTSERIPGEAAIQLGRQWGAIPRRGAPLIYSSEFHRFKNPNVFALDFTATPLPDGAEVDFADSWQVDVVWRLPVWGQDEIPETAHLPPQQRKPEYKWDYVTVREDTDKGRKVSDVENNQVEASTEIMKNTAGHPYREVALPRRLLVARTLFNSLDESQAIRINDALERTTNSNKFKLIGRDIEKHHARFLSIEQFDGGYYFGRRYFRNEIRIEVSTTPYYVERKSEGPFYLVAGEQQRRGIDANGVPIPSPYPLDEEGRLATESNPQASTNHLVLKEHNYGRSSLPWLFT